MKKTLCLIYCVIFILTLCACSAQKSVLGTADDEIFSYTPLDQEKKQLVISVTGSLNVAPVINKFCEENPDVQITLLDYTGGNDIYAPVYDLVVHKILPDIMFLSTGMWGFDITNFEDMSTNPLASRYQVAALNSQEQDGHIFAFPGPSSLYGMAYNKTLFEKYGWQVPHTIDELITLCQRITMDTKGEIQPWNINAKYYGQTLIPIEAGCYTDVFGGLENQEWVQSVEDGTGTFTNHAEPIFEYIQQLIDIGVITPDSYTYSATTRKQDFCNGKIAMINMGTNEVYDTDDEIDYFAFPGKNEGESFLQREYSYYLAIPSQQRTNEKQALIDRFLDYVSTPEAQKLYMGDGMLFSNLKDAEEKTDLIYSLLKDPIDNGRYFSMYQFKVGNTTGSQLIYGLSKRMTPGEITVEQAVQELDRQYAEAKTTLAKTVTVLATVPKNFTILETSEFFADMYREKTGADIALVLNNVIFRGNVMRFLSGDVTNQMVTVFKPRSNENNSTLVKAMMTGQQLLDALNAPFGKENTIADCTYAFSGLKCTVAPWNAQGKRMVDVKLANGEAIDPAKEYTVAFWTGTVNDSFITQTVMTYPDTFEELLTAKITTEGTLVPANDKRTTLVWNSSNK